MERGSKRELRWIWSMWLAVALVGAGTYGYLNGSLAETPQIGDRAVMAAAVALGVAIVVALALRATFRSVRRVRTAKAHSRHREVIDLRNSSRRTANRTALPGELASYYHDGFGVWVSDHGERGRWVQDPRTQRWVPLEQYETTSAVG